ncbi:MAG: eCIS core domain-containing protein [Thermoanaerobaculia bacterium]
MVFDRKVPSVTAAIERRRATSATVQRSAAAIVRPPARTLQERVGNHATQVLIARSVQEPKAPGPPAVSKPNEAAKIPTEESALKVMRKCVCDGGAAGGSGEASCDDCAKKKVERKVASGASPEYIPASVNDVVASAGRPLHAATRAFMESRFAHDFSAVRVHDDARAAASARGVGALAYTIGNDIVFDDRRYEPSSTEGRRLLAHELTHVVQQSPVDDVSRRANTISDPGEASEIEADRIAGQIVGSASPVPAISEQRSVRAVPLQRQPRRGQAGPREATVNIRWSEDLDRFFDRVLAALARSPGFRGIDPQSFNYYSDAEPGLRAFVASFHTQYSMSHSDRKEGKPVQVYVSADYDPHHGFHGSDLTNKKISFVENPAESHPKPAAPAPRRPAGGSEPDEITARTIAARFVDASNRGHICAKFRLTFDGNKISESDYEVDPHDHPACLRAPDPSKRRAPLSEAEAYGAVKRIVDMLVSGVPGSIEATFSFERGLVLERWDNTPLPPKPEPVATDDAEEMESEKEKRLEKMYDPDYEEDIENEAGALGIAWDVFGWDSPTDFAADVALTAVTFGIGKFIKWAIRGRKARKKLEKIRKLRALRKTRKATRLKKIGDAIIHLVADIAWVLENFEFVEHARWVKGNWKKIAQSYITDEIGEHAGGGNAAEKKNLLERFSKDMVALYVETTLGVSSDEEKVFFKSAAFGYAAGDKKWGRRKLVGYFKMNLKRHLTTNAVYQGIRMASGESELSSSSVIDVTTFTVGEMVDDLIDRLSGFGAVGEAAIEVARKALVTTMNRWIKTALD